MAINFVSTSILSSTDGIAFEKDEIKDTEEVKKIKLESEKGLVKPLYEQLAIQQAKKQEEYEANTKKIFGIAQLSSRYFFNFETLSSTTESPRRRRCSIF